MSRLKGVWINGVDVTNQCKIYLDSEQVLHITLPEMECPTVACQRPSVKVKDNQIQYTDQDGRTSTYTLPRMESTEQQAECNCFPKCPYSCTCECHNNKQYKRGNEWL